MDQRVYGTKCVGETGVPFGHFSKLTETFELFAVYSSQFPTPTLFYKLFRTIEDCYMNTDSSCQIKIFLRRPRMGVR